MKQFWWAVLMIIAWLMTLIWAGMLVWSISNLSLPSKNATVVWISYNADDVFESCAYYPKVNIEWETWSIIELTDNDCAYSGTIKIWQKMKIKYDANKLSGIETINVRNSMIIWLVISILFWYLTYVWYEMTRKEKRPVASNPQL